MAVFGFRWARGIFDEGVGLLSGSRLPIEAFNHSHRRSHILRHEVDTRLISPDGDIGVSKAMRRVPYRHQCRDYTARHGCVKDKSDLAESMGFVQSQIMIL